MSVKRRSRRLLHWGVLGALILLIASCATTTSGSSEDGGSADGSETVPESYPERPVELTVVYPAGGGMDVTARALGSVAEKESGDEFRVINRDGAGGLVGHTYLAKQAGPDGYELGVVAVDFLVFDTLLRDSEFSDEDFAPLAYIAFDPIIQVVRADSELGDLSYEEILARGKQNPGDIRVGIMRDTTFDVFTSVVEGQSGAEFTKVPFDGGQPGVTALLGGQIDMTNAFYAEVEPYLKSGELKAVAISDTEPYPALPDVPTATDVGIDVPEKTFGAGRMIVAPNEMEEGLQKHLADMFMETMEGPVAAAEFADVGAPLDPRGREEAVEIYETAFKELGDAIEQPGGESG
ncbi:MAG: hypothetical protein GEU93_00395 [Propionibacteriales bacterium]|nr:hypothetical protein [Propionibacteriales bacterium]